jgi:hypothetical protein
LLPAVEPGGDMVKDDLWHEIHSRFKLQETKKSIARAVGLSVQTVRKILRQKGVRPIGARSMRANFFVPIRSTSFNGWQPLATVGRRSSKSSKAGATEAVAKRSSVSSAHCARKRRSRPRSGSRRRRAGQAQADWGPCWTIVAGKRG